METLASRYANALLSIALEEKKNSEYRNEIKDIVNTFEESEDLLSVLHSAFITKEEKKKLLSTILKDEKYPYIKDFILVIIDNSRERELLEILKEFIKLSNIEDGICEGYVYSTIRLSKEEMNKITASIEQKLNKKVFLHNKLDETLIGGVKVIVDEYVFDGSIKNKLKELRHQLQEGA